jgi:hypothetical protein
LLTAGGDQSAHRPIVVLSYRYSGAAAFQDRLARYPDFVCTSGTGIIPMCDMALQAWLAVEGRGNGRPSALAVSSVRSLASVQISSIFAHHGGRRWCERATCAPEAAESFLQVFPGALIVCLYEHFDVTLSRAIKTEPWGFVNVVSADIGQIFPGNAIAYLAAYWLDRMVRFESLIRSSSENIRWERVSALDPGSIRRADLEDFLGLAACRSTAGRIDDSAEQGAAPLSVELSEGITKSLPPGLAERISSMERRLDQVHGS